MRDEAELIALVRGGQVDAYSDLVHMHQADVRSYLARFLRDAATADDLAQETFLRAYRFFDTFDASRPLVRWLIGIARNEALAYLRSERRRQKREQDRLDERLAEALAGRAAGEDAAGADWRLDALVRCLSKLEGDGERLVKKYYFEHLDAQTIAGAMGRSANSVRIALFRLRAALRQCITSSPGREASS